ncbi:hypothetical protein AB0I53_32845 [Saccharopolyspora sp. NPDC050389]|uniref:hypothetical protein n=1 Tax=Saccharopolyspora sp. NPDC050389 TaxID=3155516 RepID=UPI0033E973F0
MQLDRRSSRGDLNALRAAGDRARGATAVVTLEPCNHVGRTPACHQALIDAGIARVVVALVDPTSRGEGGIARLRQAGVDVVVGVAEDEARALMGPWLRSVELGRPVLIWGTAVTDGATQTENESARMRLRAWAAPGVDVIVDEHGRATEAVPGTHGDDVLRLPSEPLPHDPSEAVTVLHHAGARRVLLLDHHQNATQSPLISQQWVDRLLVLTCDPGTPSLTTPQTAAIPDDWFVDRLHPVPGGVVAEYRHAPAWLTST